MNFKTLALFAAVSATSLIANADRGRWFGDSHDRIRGGRTVVLGNIQLGDNDRRGHFADRDVLNLRNNPAIECNLTHLKFTALNDSVRIYRVELQYRSGQVDSLDLNQDNFGGNQRRGIRLLANQSSQWLNVNDVLDNRDSGRCIDKIRVTGVDSPNNLLERHFGNSRPAFVMVSGIVSPRMHRPPVGRPPVVIQPPVVVRPPARAPMTFLGSLKFTLFKSDNESFVNKNVKTPVRKLAIESEGTYVNHVILKYTNGSSHTISLKKNVNYELFSIPEGVIASVSAKGSGGRISLYVSR